ncbi:MAG TPA: rod shape-determining protein MreC [bacterium]|nr:rod shape-determining protein MreC [bacterium]
MNRKKIFLYILAVSIVLAFAIPNFILEYTPRSVAADSMKSFFQHQIETVRNTVRIIIGLKNVGKKNIELEREISELKVRLIMNEAIKKENEELSKLLKLKDSYGKYTIIPARILNFSDINPNRIVVSFPQEYSKLMAEKATVVSSMGLVGLVSSFHTSRAEVELITSKQFTIPAVLENREECTAILKGNGQSLSILFLDKVCNIPPADGKKLLSANLSENYSIPYLPIGIISSLKEDEGNILFTRGEAIPLFKKGKLNHIFIIVGTNTKDEKPLF